MATSKPKGHDSFNAVQRFRTQVDFIASESLKGVVFFEIGKSDWGRDGAGIGTDGKDVKVRYSYIDWIVPQTDLKVRMGLQAFILPNFVAGDNIIDDDAAGISLAYQFNDMVGVNLFWMRALDNGYSKEENVRMDSLEGTALHDGMDLFGLTIPVKGDGFKVTPWGMVGQMGRNVFNSSNAAGDIKYVQQGMLPYGAGMAGSDFRLSNSDDRTGTPWWLGIGGELTMFNPFRIAAEFRYGSVDMGSIASNDVRSIPNMGSEFGYNETTGEYTNKLPQHDKYFTDNKIKEYDFERSGWYAGLIAEYKLDFMTPGLIFWYTSGDDGNPYNGSERMPSIYGSWKASNFGFDNGSNLGTYRMVNSVAQQNIGTWGVVAQLKDITFLEDLKHTLKFGFYQGTNNKNMPVRAGMSDFRSNVDGLYMTTKDNAWEVSFVTDYKIYKDLGISLDLAYIRLDMDKSVWEPALGTDKWNKREKNNYRVGLYMQYNF